MRNQNSEPDTDTSTVSEQNTSQPGDIDWQVLKASEEDSVLGFLQICIERRFHRAVQLEFQKKTGLSETNYWLQADVGGSPLMEENRKAADYCYKLGAKLMGWSAHGASCGGFPGIPDAEIQAKLLVTLRGKASEYPRAKHYAFFATERNNEMVVLYRTLGPIEGE